MNILVDTQSVIWFAENNPALNKKARLAIEDTNNPCFVSMASFWEMSIKMNLGKLSIKGLTLGEFMKEVEGHGFTTLDISKDHILKNGTLPFHHRDPFDRLIIAQALVEGWHTNTSDDVFEACGVQRI
jgi:PIN domain nuclease of toxin-antitoxin system